MLSLKCSCFKFNKKKCNKDSYILYKIFELLRHIYYIIIMNDLNNKDNF